LAHWLAEAVPGPCGILQWSGALLLRSAESSGYSCFGPCRSLPSRPKFVSRRIASLRDGKSGCLRRHASMRATSLGDIISGTRWVFGSFSTNAQCLFCACRATCIICAISAHPLSAGGISWRSVSISGVLAELALERQAGDQPTLEQGAGFQPILAPARGCRPHMG
jgi:hypothetical protein